MKRTALLYVIISTFFLVVPSIGGGEFFRWFALIPLLFLIQKEGLSYKKLGGVLWLVGFFFLLLQYSIFWSLLPLDWMGISNSLLGVLVLFLIWVFLAGFISLPFIFFVFARNRLFLFPLLWILQEYCRALLYSLITLGNSSFLGDIFTYGFLGYTAHTSQLLLSLTPYLHLYGMSFSFAVVNVLFFFAIRAYITKKDSKIIFFIMLGMSALLAVEYSKLPAAIAPKEREIGVIALQGDNPFMYGYTEEYFNHSAEMYKRGIVEGLQEYPETSIIVVPEASQFIRTLSRQEGKTAKELVQELLPDDHYRVLVYGDYDDVRDISIVGTISNDESEGIQESQKLLLMPLGEYQPYLVQAAARILGKKEWIEELLFYRNLDRPQEEGKTIQTRLASLSAVSCSEVFAGSVYRNIREKDPDMVVHLQRLASFHGNKRVYEEGLRVSKFRAAELGKPIIGAVDGSGYSYIINSRGEIVAQGKKDSLFVFGNISFKK